MRQNGLIGIGIGFMLLLCLPFILTEHEIRTEQHIHTVEVVNMLGNVKPVTVTFCHENQMLVNRLGEYYESERVKEILERYE